MLIYLEPGFDSPGIGRIATQMYKYFPKEHEISGDANNGDLHIVHVIGRRDHVQKRTEKILRDGGKYVICQYVLESCRNPNPEDWKQIWDGAKFVFSYYKLPTPNLYHSPLGVDPSVFYKEDIEKKYSIGTNGYDFKNECIGEVQLAVWNTGTMGAHVGTNFNSNPIIDYYPNISDDEFRKVYNQCEHWSALRRKDGFEMVALEAMMCGVRPIMFDTPNYRQWFDGLVDFIPEKGVDEVSGHIKRIIKNGPRNLSEAEIETIKNNYNWEKIMK